MITSDKYLILDSITSVHEISEKLCIINFDILEYSQILEDFIKTNPNTTFWAVTNDFSKKYILAASKLGIKNVIHFPIKKELINDFFKSTESKTQEISKYFNYEPLKNSKVVIIDDNRLNIELLEAILSDIGVQILSFGNPSEALETINTKKCNLFLLDILMPEISGFELAEIIKKSEINKDSPIIFISAISGNENIMNGYSLGAYSYIEKPFSPSIVKAQIYNILKGEEEKKEQEKLKESFIASLTHDLKNPINAEITALKHLITKDSNEDINSEILFDLLNSAQYMKFMTDKILSHYKQKNNKIILKKENVHFYPFVLSCIEEIRFLCEDKNIKIYLNNEIGDTSVIMDKIEIKRVINNLIANAVEYSHKNNRIDIQLTKDNKNIIFRIKDYDYGIDLKKHKYIFDEYMSLSKEYQKTGFGLGLNICKAIIEAHKGEITIESAINKGTCVCFKIPLAK